MLLNNPIIISIPVIIKSMDFGRTYQWINSLTLFIINAQPDLLMSFDL